MSLTRQSLCEIKERFRNIFCLVAAEPVDEKWATCYSCHVAMRVISHLPISGCLDTSDSQHIPVGVCLEIDVPYNKLISIVNFERTQHIILCIKCLGDSFLAIDGTLFSRCTKCLCFFNNVESHLDGMYWENFQDTEYDKHVAGCKISRKEKNIHPTQHNHQNPSHNISHNIFTRFLPKKRKEIKPFLIRKDQIK